MLNKRRKRFRDITEARPSQFPYGYVYKGSTVPYQSQYLITPPYPVRPEDAATSGPVVLFASATQWPLEELTLGMGVTSFVLGQTFFPVNHTYRREGGSDHEDLAIGMLVTTFDLTQTAVPPVNYNYLQAGQSAAEFHEDLAIAMQVTTFNLETGEFFPLEYENWPVEELEIGMSVTSFTLEAA